MGVEPNFNFSRAPYIKKSGCKERTRFSKKEKRLRELLHGGPKVLQASRKGDLAVLGLLNWGRNGGRPHGQKSLTQEEERRRGQNKGLS